MIELRDVCAGYRGRTAVDGFSLEVARGERVAVAGPNGAGKSSVLRVVTGLLPAARGTVRVAGRAVAGMSPRERARRMAVVPQDVARDVPFAGLEYVLLGRSARLPRFGRPGAEDEAAAARAMAMTETAHLAGRRLAEMSGGERQRLALALALAAEPEVVLLDEPTSHLDLRHRAELMAVLARLERERAVTVVMVVHDLTLASQCFGRVVLMRDGRKVADGAPGEVLTAEMLEAVYGCAVEVSPLAAGGVCVAPRPVV